MAPPRTTGPKSAKAAAFMRKAVEYFEAGDLPKAQKNVTKYLSTDPKNADANHLAGLIAMNVGHPEQAFKFIKRALDANPHNAMCHSNLGEAYRALEKLPEAEASYRKAIELEPTIGGFYNNLGIALAGQSKTSDAIAAYETGLTHTPHDPMILTNLGNARLDAGHVQGAIDTQERAIKLNPASVEAHANLGLALMARGNITRAREAFDTVLARHPTHVPALNALAEIMDMLGEIDQAHALREKIIAILPDDQDVYFEFADALRLSDQPDEAIAVLERCAARTHQPADALVEIANVHRASGNRDRTLELLNAVLKKDRNHIKARALLANISKSEPDNDNTAVLMRLAGTPDLPSELQTRIHFALGKAMDDISDYDAAAQHYGTANAIRRKELRYTSETSQQQVAEIKKYYVPPLFDAKSAVGTEDSTPIFIVGMPRSGTSLVEQIIASHSHVRGAGELATLGQTANHISAKLNLSLPQDIAKLDDQIFNEIGRTYVSLVRKRFGDAQHITDKLPHNFLQVGLIRLALPHAKIIHCQRHPMDTCLSIFKSTFAEAHSYSYDLGELGTYYRDYLDLMAHWRATLPGAMYEISYEALVDDTEAEARALLAHCELEWEPACLEFYKTKRTVNTTSASQVRQPIYRSSVALWKRYGDHLRPLIDALGDAIPPDA